MITVKLRDFGTERIILNKFNHRTKKAPLHIHNFIEVVYIESGIGYHIISGEKYEVKKGDIFIINTWMAHKFTPKGNHDLIVINCLIDPSYFKKRLFCLSERKVEADFVSHCINNKIYNKNEDMRFKNRDSQHIAGIFDAMYAEYSIKDLDYQLVLENYLHILFYKLIRMYIHDDREVKTKHEEIITNAIDYIKANYTSNVDIGFISRHYNISQKYLSKLFKKYLSMTVIQYIQKLRIEKALHLLQTTDNCISDIAYDVGYNDIGFFYDLFKRYTGMNPGCFKKQFLQHRLQAHRMIG
jgi:AraC-like DNA-binding protein